MTHEWPTLRTPAQALEVQLEKFKPSEYLDSLGVMYREYAFYEPLNRVAHFVCNESSDAMNPPSPRVHAYLRGANLSMTIGVGMPDIETDAQLRVAIHDKASMPVKTNFHRMASPTHLVIERSIKTQSDDTSSSELQARLALQRESKTYLDKEAQYKYTVRSMSKRMYPDNPELQELVQQGFGFMTGIVRSEGLYEGMDFEKTAVRIRADAIIARVSRSTMWRAMLHGSDQFTKNRGGA